MLRNVLCALALAALLLSGSAASAADRIHAGVDGWKTVSSTYSTFAGDPIPADFFCPGSLPFTGRVELRGVPIVTEPAGAFQGQDTVIRRHDDAVFDAEGVAHTTISLVALNLESIEPVATGCGLYNVRVVLDEEQPTTEMTIVRETELGGTFEAPLALNTRVIFSPVEGGESLEVPRRIDLGPGSQSVWIETPYDVAKTVRIDSDGDGVTDREVPLRSNFRAGVVPAGAQVYAETEKCVDTSCHCTSGSINPNEPNTLCPHLHCIEVVVPCELTPIATVRPVLHSATPETMHP